MAAAVGDSRVSAGENAEKFTKEEEEDENGSSIGAGR